MRSSPSDRRPFPAPYGELAARRLRRDLIAHLHAMAGGPDDISSSADRMEQIPGDGADSSAVACPLSRSDSTQCRIARSTGHTDAKVRPASPAPGLQETLIRRRMGSWRH